MANAVNKLSARRVQTLSEVGRHSDGGGLYLVVDAAGSKRWVLLYRAGGRRREMGLGPIGSVTLARARELAAEARSLIAGGVDPIEARRTQPGTAKPVAPPMTFGAVADAYMRAQEASWRSPVHKRQWRQTLEVHASSLWTMPVAHVDTEAVLRVLRPIWQAKPETAQRLRGRIERVLNAARAGGQASPQTTGSTTDLGTHATADIGSQVVTAEGVGAGADGISPGVETSVGPLTVTDGTTGEMIFDDSGANGNINPFTRDPNLP